MASPVTLEKGQFLFLQGQLSDSFYILKNGHVEILINKAESFPNEKDVLSEGRRIAVLDKQNVPIGEIGVLDGTMRTASVRALDRCELIQMSGDQDGFLKWVHGNLQAALLVSRTLASRVVDNHRRWHEISLLDRRMTVYVNNLTILYSIFSSKTQQQTSFAALIQKGRELVAGLDPEKRPNLSNLERDLPDESAPAARNEPFQDIELGYFFNLLLAQPDTALNWLISDPSESGFTFVAGRLTEILTKISRHVHAEMKSLEATVQNLFGSHGIIAAFVHLYVHAADEHRETVLPFLHKLLTIARNLRESVIASWGETFPMNKELNESIALLAKAISEKRAPGQAPSLAPVAAEVSAPREMLDLPRAVALCNLSPEEEDAFAFCIGKREIEPVKAYRAYWKIYAKLWAQNRKKENRALTAFLRYGIASPVPVEKPEELNLETTASGPILYGDQWLNRIYNAESPSSRTDLGQTYQEVLRENKATQYVPEEPDSQMDLVLFEVDNMMAKASRAFSGGRGELALLRRTPGEITALAEKMTTTAKVAEALVKVIRTDFTAFFRDVRVMLSERSEFLPAEVIPFVILLPASGGRAMAWQEFEGRAKDTPGRLILPLLPDGDIFDLVVTAVAKFRWDLAKSIAGADWMSPTDGGVTGRYFDYAAYYKKNPDLSDEQKKVLEQMFSTLTMDADKFAAEYSIWIKAESQGIQKLNKVARRIFAEFCPFTMEIRTRLIRQPAYADILRKDSNKRLKKREEILRRVQKLKKDEIDPGDVFDCALRMYEPIPE